RPSAIPSPSMSRWSRFRPTRSTPRSPPPLLGYSRRSSSPRTRPSRSAPSSRESAMAPLVVQPRLLPRLSPPPSLLLSLLLSPRRLPRPHRLLHPPRRHLLLLHP